MSKYKVGDKVWVQGEYHIDDNGSHWVRIKCHYAIRDQGECNVKVPSKYLKPDVTFPWSPAKKAKKQRSKK
jgi:hypothetical protein